MDGPNLVELTAEIVSAFVSNNKVAPADLAELIVSTHASLGQVISGTIAEKAEPLTPPVSIKKSQTPDYLISLEDGRRYKSLKRHLTRRGLTPEGYRAKWGLPTSYPMVAENYAKKRSDLAKSMGLGRIKQVTDAPAAPLQDQGPAPRARQSRVEAEN